MLIYRLNELSTNDDVFACDFDVEEVMVRMKTLMIVMMMMMTLLCKYEYSHMLDDWKGG